MFIINNKCFVRFHFKVFETNIKRKKDALNEHPFSFYILLNYILFDFNCKNTAAIIAPTEAIINPTHNCEL